jgi:hypothetical protein
MHTVEIRSPATAPLVAEVRVDHGTDCSTGSGRYNFTVHSSMNGNGRDLRLPDAVGSVWRFGYMNSWFLSGNSGDGVGIHSWVILGADRVADTTTLSIADIRDDSLSTRSYGGSRRLDTLYSTITITADSVFMMLSEIAPAFRRIPRRCLGVADTVQYSLIDGTYGSYREGIGLIRYKTGPHFGINFNETYLQLLDFTPGMPAAVTSWEPKTPATLALEQNYPNPFNPSTTMRFTVPQRGDVDLGLYDVTGRLVRSLLHAAVDAGTYTVHIDASTLSSGVYLCRLQQGGAVATRRLVLIR